MKALYSIERGLDKLISGLYFGVGLSCVFVMISMTYGIISRYFFSVSIGWISEISAYALVTLAFLAAPKMLRDGGHVRVDLMHHILSKKKTHVLRCFGGVVGIIVFSLIFVFAIIVSVKMFQTGVRTDTFLRIPRGILISLSAFGIILITIQYFRNLIKALRNPESEREQGEEL